MSMILKFILSSTLSLAHSPTPPPTLGGLDLYGSEYLTIDMIKASHGELLQKCLDEFLRGEVDSFQTDSQRLSQELMEHYDLAFAKLSVITYVDLHNIPGRQVYATIDVVEPGDVNRRMKFLPRPTETPVIPSDRRSRWESL